MNELNQVQWARLWGGFGIGTIRSVRFIGRWVVRVAAVLSLLICLAITGLGIRSIWRFDKVVWSESHAQVKPGSQVIETFGNSQSLGSTDGGLFFQSTNSHWSNAVGTVSDWHIFHWAVQEAVGYPYFPGYPIGTPSSARDYRGFGFEWMDGKSDDQVLYAESDRVITVPIPVLTLLFVILPVVVGRGFVRQRTERRRIVGNLCVKCGYDLRGSAGRCPECGAVFGAGVI